MFLVFYDTWIHIMDAGFVLYSIYTFFYIEDTNFMFCVFGTIQIFYYQNVLKKQVKSAAYVFQLVNPYAGRQRTYMKCRRNTSNAFQNPNKETKLNRPMRAHLHHRKYRYARPCNEGNTQCKINSFFPLPIPLQI